MSLTLHLYVCVCVLSEEEHSSHCCRGTLRLSHSHSSGSTGCEEENLHNVPTVSPLSVPQLCII